jgi:uncharacterized protein YjiS (DUF1127 family)
MSTIRTISSDLNPIEPARAANRLVAFLSAVALLAQAMAERSRSRRALSALNDDELKDIGLSRSDAYRETRRPFWD